MSNEKARDLNRGLLLVVLAVVADTLFLVPVTILAVTGSGWLWPVLVVYLASTVGIIAIVVVSLRRSGRSLLGPISPVLVRTMGIVLVATAAFIAVAAWKPGWTPLWLAVYVVALLAGVIAVVRWQARHYRLRCDSCGAVFAAPTATWLISVNMGAYKHVPCAQCGHGWAEVIRDEADLP